MLIAFHPLVKSRNILHANRYRKIDCKQWCIIQFCSCHKFYKTAIWRTAKSPAAKFQNLEVWPWLWVCIAESWVLYTVLLRGTFEWRLMKSFQKVQEIWSRHEIQFKSHDLEVWPWPWVWETEPWALHTISLRLTFHQSLMKIFQRVQELWSRYELQGLTHDLKVWPWVCIAISWVLHTVSLRVTFGWSLMKIIWNIQEIWSGHKLKGKSHDLEVWTWPWVCIAESWVLHTVSLWGNIWAKLNENHWKGSGDTEQARNSRVNPMTLKCDLNLESG